MNLKYKVDIDGLKLPIPCPPKGSIGKNAPAYRFTFEDINDPNNFIPQFVKKPGRANDKSDLEKCSGYGLSMYETEEKAITSYTKLSLFVNKIEKVIGSHLSMATLANNEGLCTETDSEGHFDFHVFENVDLSARFQVIKPLK